MNFLEAQQYIKSCVEKWQLLKSQFNGRERELLEQSYLVLAYPSGQLNISELNPEGLTLNHPNLLANAGHNLNFVKLINKKTWLKNQIEKLQRILQWTENQIQKTNTDLLELNNFTVEARFNQLNFDLIQKLKQSELVDKSKTDISRASIRIVLKGQDSQDNRDG